MSYYRDDAHGYEGWESSNQRLLGCIPAKIQAAKARERGELSDEQQIARLAAPWDKTNTPSIIQWDDKWRDWLKELAGAYDILRDFGKLPPVWQIAKFYGYSLEELCGTRQLINDCTAWGVTRASICLAIMQRWLGAEIQIDKYNPSGNYAYSSGYAPRANERVPDNGRTIYAAAKAACEAGNYTVADIGDYRGVAAYTPSMIKTAPDAQQRQTGWVYLGDGYNGRELADIILLSLRAGRPAIIGNTVALQDGVEMTSDLVPVSRVGGGWGGGHCTAAVDVKKVNNAYYIWIYNSHGNLYKTNTNAPAAGTYITYDGLVKYLSGSYADVMLTTYTESPHAGDNHNLNPEAARA